MAFKALPVAEPVAGAVVDSISLGARLAWPCYRLRQSSSLRAGARSRRGGLHEHQIHGWTHRGANH